MQSGGYFRDTFNGQRLLDNNVDVARLKIKWQPTETLTLLLSGDYSEITGNGAAFKLISVTPGMPLTLLPGAQPNVDGERSIASYIGGDPYENQSQLDNRYRSEEHTSELQSLMRISYAVFCLKKKKDTSNKIMYK